MKTRYLLIASILYAVFATAGAFGETLSLNDFITKAVENNPRYQISAKDYLIALYENKGTRSLEDLNLIASATFQDGTPPSSMGFLSAKQNSTGLKIGLQKYLAATGTAFNLEYGLNRTQSDIPVIPGFTPPEQPYYTSTLSFTITQPLLKNGFGLITKKSLEMSDISLKLAEIKLKEDWDSFIASLHDDFRLWQKCHLNVAMYKDQLNRVSDQLNLIERQRKVGLSEELDLVQIRQKLQAYKARLEAAVMECDAQTRRIGYIMGASTANTNIEPEKFSGNSEVSTREQALAYLKGSSNILKSAGLLVSIASIGLDMKNNETLPNLDLVLTAQPNSISGDPSEAVSNTGSNQNYVATILLSRPLFNEAADSGSKKAAQEYDKALDQSRSTMLNSTSALDALYTNLEHLLRIEEQSIGSVSLAKERLSLEQEKFKQGRNSVFFILAAEEDLLMAENSLNETLFAKDAVINQIRSFTDEHIKEYSNALNAKDLLEKDG